MDSYTEVMGSVELFRGVEAAHLRAMLQCLGAKTVAVSKDQYVLAAGDKAEHVGIVLEGRFLVVRDDIDGERSLLATLSPGDFFAEALCCAAVAESPVSVLADADGTVMLLPFQRILHTCTSACGHHSRLLENMLAILASKNLLFQDRMELLSQKSIRRRVMRYLESVAAQKGREFSIPFSREELADFLAVDRSALSRELARLKAEGHIDYWKNVFKLL